MQTNDFLGDNVGRLGLGTMRLPVIDGDQAQINQNAVNAMVDYALSHGATYFDTAYPYHGNMSEYAVGAALKRHDRDDFFLATKYPGHQIASSYDPQAIFEEQLKKCDVEYFDFYLLHNVYEVSLDVYTDEQWSIADYFIEQKRSGRIRHLGFSTHGRPETVAAFLDYGAKKYAELKARDPETAALFAGENIMEFCQIQLNYLDWTLQKGAEKCALLEDLSIPVVVMEPLRGGKLAALPKEAKARLAAEAPSRSDVAWSFDWLLGIPNVKVVLSGMSNLAQLEENCRIFSEPHPLSQAEDALLMDVAESLKDGVPCTACRYCVDSCPQSIDIPTMMATYNDLQFESSFTVSMQMDAVPEGQRAADCIACGACELICPQQIEIPSIMTKLAAQLEKMPKWADLCKQREEAALRSQQA